MDTMNTIDLTINNCSPHDLQVISSNNTHEDNTNTGVDCDTNLYDDNVLSDEGKCLFEGSYRISENSNPDQGICEEMIDFEALIDSMSKNNAVVTLPDNIKEFESVLSNFDTTSAVKLEEDLTLKEINNFFDSLTTDVDLNPQEIQDVDLNPQEIQDDDLNPQEILDIDLKPQEILDIDLNSQEIQDVDLNPQEIQAVDLNPEEIPDVDLNPQEILDIDLNTQAILDISKNICNTDMKENIIQNAYNENPTGNSEIQNTYIQINSENSQENTTHAIPALSIKEKSSKDSIIEIISVSSETSQSADEDGYNSSDFEFITEEQATIEGFIINFRRNDIPKTKTNNSKIKVKKNDSFNKFKVTNSKVKNTGKQNFETKNYQSENRDCFVDPGEGPSGLNVSNQVSHINHTSNSDESNIQSEDRNSFIDPGEGSSGLKTSDRPYRPNHIIPEGEGYLDLFRGPYDPVLPLSDIIFMENKSIRPSAMNTQYEGVGFDQQLIGRRYQPDSSEEEYEDEAKESVQMILSLYPGENRRRKSRRH